MQIQQWLNRNKRLIGLSRKQMTMQSRHEAKHNGGGVNHASATIHVQYMHSTRSCTVYSSVHNSMLIHVQ